MYVGPLHYPNLIEKNANLVFEAARNLARSGVPALTVHDEFIVPEGNEGLVREFMYTTELGHMP